MTEGRTLEQKEALIRWISAAAEELGWPLEEVREAIYEKDEWGLAESLTHPRTPAKSVGLPGIRALRDRDHTRGRPDLDEPFGGGDSTCSAGSQGPVWWNEAGPVSDAKAGSTAGNSYGGNVCLSDK